MKRRSDAKSGADAADISHTEGSASDPVDMFAGVERQPLTSQAPSTKASDGSKTGDSARSLGSTAPLAAGQPELPLESRPQPKQNR